MPRRRALTGAQLAGLLALPAAEAELARRWMLGDADLAAVGRRRRDHNRLGLALQLCALRCPGRPLRPGEAVPEPALRFVADQVGAAPEAIAAYGTRVQTRSAHLAELRGAFGIADLTPARRRELAAWLLPVAIATTSATAVAAALLEETRRRHLIVPGEVAAALFGAEGVEDLPGPWPGGPRVSGRWPRAGRPPAIMPRATLTPLRPSVQPRRRTA